jgi:hypothetical protein
MRPTDQQLHDTITTAVEHGGYGSLIWTDPPIAGRFPSERIAASIIAGIGVPVIDRWDYDQTGTVTKAGLIDGIEAIENLRGYTVDNFDVTDADAAAQIAAYGEVMFG